MNTVIETIKKRRSVRSYEAKPVPRNIVNGILEAGNEAPSAMNSQPWRFVVVEDKDAKKEAARRRSAEREEDHRAGEGRGPGAVRIHQEALCRTAGPGLLFSAGDRLRHRQWTVCDHSCPLACENMMLAAHALGLGSCWVGFGRW